MFGRSLKESLPTDYVQTNLFLKNSAAFEIYLVRKLRICQQAPSPQPKLPRQQLITPQPLGMVPYNRIYDHLANPQIPSHRP